MSNTPPLPDASAREAITGNLAHNMAVEAAAGSGKTTCLVGRLMTLFRQGALAGDARLAAMTFTHKAAVELEERLNWELNNALTGPTPLPPEERAALEAARLALPECHVGTIHSFCSRLIREHPVEAGVGPDFEELEDEDDQRLRRQIWDAFADALDRGGHPDLRQIFNIHGLARDDLFQGFNIFAQYPDVDQWPGSTPPTAADPDAFLKGTAAYRDHLEPLKVLARNADCGKDEILSLAHHLSHRLSRLKETPFGMEEAVKLLELFKEKPGTIQARWKELGLDKERCEEEKAAYRRFYDETVAPFRRATLANVYAAALRAFFLAREQYDAARLKARRVNFADLLLTTARLLREHPDVRADLAARYPRLLVDEVQDTDPVQAEIMFLLASEDPGEKDWRRCRLRPGALFLVGDPKQSIYRFRRADMTVYQEMKQRLAASGGDVLYLSVNFRSQPVLLDWINQTFEPAGGTAGVAGGTTEDIVKELAEGTAEESMLAATTGPVGKTTKKSAKKTAGKRSGSKAESATATTADDDDEAAAEDGGRFPALETPYSPAYVPMIPGQPDAGEGCFAGVFRLEMAAEKRSGENAVSRGDIFQDEAERIARFIRHAVDTGLLLPGRDKPRPADPGDFLIISQEKARTGIYAAALRALGLPCRLSGGATLRDTPALPALLSYIQALAEPDNGIRVLAVLRGRLFGIADTDLYRWKKAGGQFLFTAERPADPAAPPAIAAALEGMARHHALFRKTEPAAALAAVAEDLGLWALACLGDDPDGGAARLAAALELLRVEAPDLATPGTLAERLQRLLDEHEEDILPAREQPERAVRVMNLHKTKGLEAAVVFLTCTKGKVRKPVRFAVRRSETLSRAAMPLTSGERQSRVVAQPADWEELAAEEERFLAAEATRLNYVAASRAGAALVVSAYKSGKIWKSAFLPMGGAGVILEQPLPEPDHALVQPAAAEVLITLDAQTLEQAATERERRRPALLTPSRTASRGKPDGDGAALPNDEEAMALGEVLHRLLALPAKARDLGKTAAALLREYGLPTDRAGETAELVRAARQSALWRRAEQAERVVREIPYAVRRGDGIERGVIDLAFREAKGWVLADFKSDRIAAGLTADAAAAKHAGQLAAYARAWKDITGEGAVETGVFFLRSGEYVTI